MNAIDPGAGYRLLKEGEEIREGDEFMLHANKWLPTKDKGNTHFHHEDTPRRRKIESGWIKCLSDCLTSFRVRCGMGKKC